MPMNVVVGSGGGARQQVAALAEADLDLDPARSPRAIEHRVEVAQAELAACRSRCATGPDPPWAGASRPHRGTPRRQSRSSHRRRAQLLDDAPDFLRSLLGHHQHRVARLHHGETRNAEHRDDAVLGPQQVVLAIEREGAPAFGVAGTVAQRFGERLPGAEIAPAAVEHRGRQVVEALHHRGVDRQRRNAGVDRVETRRVAGGRGRRDDPVRDRRLEPSQRVGEKVAGENEDPGVPQMPAAVDERRSGRRVRLLAEADHPMESVDLREPFLHFQVAVPGLRPARTDTERDHARIRLGRRHRRRERAAKRVLVLDPVIGVERDHDVGAPLRRHAGEAPADRRRGVARHRLEQDLIGRQLGQLAAHRLPELTGGADPDVARGDQRQQAIEGQPQQRAVAEQRQ